MFKSKEQKQLEKEMKAEQKRLDLGGDWHKLSDGNWLNITRVNGEISFNWWSDNMSWHYTGLNIYPIEILREILAS